MARILVSAVAVFAVALFYPGTGRAGIKSQVTLVGESLDSSQQLTPAGTDDIDCSTIQDCTAIPDDPAEGDHNPAIVFVMRQDAVVHVEASIWALDDCPDTPDAMAVGDLMRFEGLSRIRVVFDPPLDDGTPFSIQWSLGMCPVTDCQNYVLGTPPPDFCPI